MNDKQQFIKELRGLTRVVINECYGGFGLSIKALDQYKQLAGITDSTFHEHDIARDDPFLVKVVKELGSAANGGSAKLKVVEVPGDVEWHIAEYDGVEWVAENHRTWS